MVRILVILGGLGREGITNSVLTYLETIDKSNLELHLGVAGFAETEALDRVKKIEVMLHMMPGRNIKPLQYFVMLIKLIHNEKFDIVHIHGNSATLGMDTLAAKIAGCPVRIVHSRNTCCTHPMLDKIMRPIFNATYTNGFACGQEAGKWMFRNKPFTVIPNGKNIDRYLFKSSDREKLRQQYNVQDNNIIIGHVGVFNDQKNHTFLIDIFYELCRHSDNYILWLVGEDGGRQREIKEKIRKCGLENKILLLGFKLDIEKYLCAMDIMVFPSIYEGLPNAVIEWQISGLPCILSDNITKECRVMNNVEYISLRDNAQIWANKIMMTEIEGRIENQNIIRSKMAKAGFDINQNAANLKELYIQLGSGNGVNA